eukprot:scpid54540/ scgid0282/ 
MLSRHGRTRACRSLALIIAVLKCLSIMPARSFSQYRFEHEGNAIPTMSPPHASNSSTGETGFAILESYANVNGIFPGITATAASGPVRSESGIGALMPWADSLYMVSYLSNPHGGNGTGFYVIDKNLNMTKLENHQSTYANRMIHPQSNTVIIGAWVISTNGSYRTFESLLHVRVGGMAVHLTDPEHKVYMLGMDGPLWECDVYDMNCTQLFDLVKELAIPTSSGEQVHFKAAHSMNGRLVVASNTEEEDDFLGTAHGGRLAEWQGPGHEWAILANTAFTEVTGRGNFGKVIYAVGWDAKSLILKTFVGDAKSGPVKQWLTYRLPKASHAYDHLWQTEWPRIREVETERYLMDGLGQFYELSPLGWASATWGIRPVCRHLRMIPDFASYRGFLVLGGNQVSPIRDNNVVTGQAQSGLWFGKTDDLWRFGKPQGWGGVWRQDQVAANAISDPFLMTGFDEKVLHITTHNSVHPQAFITIQVDFLGTAGHVSGESWVNYTTVELPAKGYDYVAFPDGFSAHWVRLVSQYPAILTAYFHYS